MLPPYRNDAIPFFASGNPRTKLCAPVFHHLLGALLELARGNVLYVRGNVPDVAEGVLHASRAVAVELVLERLHDLGAGLNGALDDPVRVRHVDMQMHG